MNEPLVSAVPVGETPAVVPELEDDRVRLRAMTESDLPAVVEQTTDPLTVRWTSVPSPYDLAAARDFLEIHAHGWAEASGTKHWVVEGLPHDGRAGLPFAGIVDLRPGPTPDDPWYTGFALHPDARGRGLMAAAVRLAARWAFEQGAPSIYWLAAQGNFASRRVAWATGFSHLGTLPAHLADRTVGTTDAWCAVLRPGAPLRPRHPWHVPAALTGEGVRLRPLHDDDHALAGPYDDPPHHVPPWALPTSGTFDDWLLHRRERMAAGAAHSWCIADVTTDEPLGEVLVFSPSGLLTPGSTGELAYLVRPDARGRGVATSAARAATHHALLPVDEGGLGLRRLVARTSSDNDASNRVLTACGFTRWGREPGAEGSNGSVIDADHWSRAAG